MRESGIGGVIGYFVYFWVFQIGGFIMFRIMGLVDAHSDWKHVAVLFVILGIAYTGLFIVKIRGDRKRAARQANAEFETKGTRVHKKKKKRR